MSATTHRTTPPPKGGTLGPRAAIIVNPTKFDGHHVGFRARRAAVDELFLERGWQRPLWASTTAELPGGAQAEQALRAGVDVVVVGGGDGTVRAVATRLAGRGVPLVLLPAGTGNLLARNLDVPLGDLHAAFGVVFHGIDRAVDVVRVSVDRTGHDAEPEEHVSLVMAGVGFDAAVVAGAGHVLKRRLGHLAYVVSGLRAVRRAPGEFSVAVDGGAPRTRHCHGAMAGNCGTVTMGLILLPAARLSDGLLDGVVFAPRNLAQWGRLLLQIALRRPSPRLMPTTRGRQVRISCPNPQPVQIDGDVLGTAVSLTLTVDAGALLVRCEPGSHPVGAAVAELPRTPDAVREVTTDGRRADAAVRAQWASLR